MPERKSWAPAASAVALPCKPRSPYNHAFVCHGGHVGAARGAAAQHHRHLRDARRRHTGLGRRRQGGGGCGRRAGAPGPSTKEQHGVPAPQLERMPQEARVCLRRHLVVENAAKVVAVRENVSLPRQVGTACAARIGGPTFPWRFTAHLVLPPGMPGRRVLPAAGRRSSAQTTLPPLPSTRSAHTRAWQHTLSTPSPTPSPSPESTR